MQISKWGNSYGVRIPADVMRALSLKEGDQVELCALDDGRVAVISEQQRRTAMLVRMRELSFPFPDDFKFDREEANAR